jgi:hypothetical protein
MTVNKDVNTWGQGVHGFEAKKSRSPAGVGCTLHYGVVVATTI